MLVTAGGYIYHLFHQKGLGGASKVCVWLRPAGDGWIGDISRSAEEGGGKGHRSDSADDEWQVRFSMAEHGTVRAAYLFKYFLLLLAETGVDEKMML